MPTPPLAAAGPVHAPPPSPRSYSHDGFVTVSYALLLPDLPTRIGSLTSMLAVTAPAERRNGEYLENPMVGRGAR